MGSLRGVGYTESCVGRASIGLGQSRAALLRALAGGFDEGREP
jgi:hypothetical protein